MKNLLYYIKIFLVGLFVTSLGICVIITPIINWIPILSHLVVLILIIMLFSLICGVGETFLNELQKSNKKFK